MGIIPSILSSLIGLIELLIVAECIMSWVVRGRSEVMDMIHNITGPILEPFRRLQYKFLGDVPVDISPIFALMLLSFMQKLVYVIF